MNAYIKRFVSRSQNLVDFLHHFQRALSYLRYTEFVADFKSMNGQPVLTTGLEAIELNGAKIYTWEAFHLFRHEIKLAGACVVCSCKQQVTTRTYRVKRFMTPNKFWDVHVDTHDNVRLTCTCGKLQSFGIPCQHIIFVMVQEDIDYLPPCLIVSCWTKNAKEVGLQNVDMDDHGDQLVGLRFGSLIQQCRYLCNLASRSNISFHTMKETIQTLTKDLEDKMHNQTLTKDVEDKMPNQRGSQSTPIDLKKRVLNPLVTRSKGRPSGGTPSSTKRKKHCAICRVEGHTRVTCPSRTLHDSTQSNTGPDSAMGTQQGPQMSQEVALDGDDCFFDALMVTHIPPAQPLR